MVFALKQENDIGIEEVELVLFTVVKLDTQSLLQDARATASPFVCDPRWLVGTLPKTVLELYPPALPSRGTNSLRGG